MQMNLDSFLTSRICLNGSFKEPFIELGSIFSMNITQNYRNAVIKYTPETANELGEKTRIPFPN